MLGTIAHCRLAEPCCSLCDISYLFIVNCFLSNDHYAKKTCCLQGVYYLQVIKFYKKVSTLSVRGPSYASESDVCKCQILICKDGPRTERIKIFITAVDP